MSTPPGPAVTVEDIRRAYYDQPSVSPTMWITEIQLAPPQLIVTDEATGSTYRIPVTLGSGGAVTFGDAVQVAIVYVDSPDQVAAAARGQETGWAGRWGSPGASRHGTDDQAYKRMFGAAQHDETGTLFAATPQREAAEMPVTDRDERRIAAAVTRGAIPPSRAAHWRAQAAAGADIGVLDELAAIPEIAGSGVSAARRADDDYDSLWPSADQIDAAAAARSREIRNLTDDQIVARLYGPGS